MHFIASGSSIKLSLAAYFHILVYFNDNTRCGTSQTMSPSRVKQRNNIRRKEKKKRQFIFRLSWSMPKGWYESAKAGHDYKPVVKESFFFHEWWQPRSDAFNETAFPTLRSDAHASSGLAFAHALMWCHLVAHVSWTRWNLSEPRRQLFSHLSLNRNETKYICFVEQS